MGEPPGAGRDRCTRLVASGSPARLARGTRYWVPHGHSGTTSDPIRAGDDQGLNYPIPARDRATLLREAQAAARRRTREIPPDFAMESGWKSVEEQGRPEEAETRTGGTRVPHEPGYMTPDAVGQAAPVRSDTPTVSIGLPVFNGEATIGVAIAAILGQSFADIELVISDNASTDATLAICEAVARRDLRVRVLRQPRNLGPVANFEAVLRAARGPYFMFAAADDRVAPHAVAEMLAMIEAAPGAAACAPRALIEFAGGRTREARGSGAITGPACLRLARFLLRPSDNTRFYGLYRTGVMRAAYIPGRAFHGFDWVVSALTLAMGGHLRSASIVLHREGAAPGKYHRHLFAEERSWLHRLLPVARMSAELLARLGPRHRVCVLPSLIVVNLHQSLFLVLSMLRGRLRP